MGEHHWVYAIFDSKTSAEPIGFAVWGSVMFEPDGGEPAVYGFDVTGKAVYEDESDY